MSDYFCGWYFKCQSNDHTVALIPAYHENGVERACSIQLITDENAWTVSLTIYYFHRKKDRLFIKIGENLFSEKGIRLQMESGGIQAFGHLKFGEFTPIRYDIMGPFRFMPFMECRHSIYSMMHRVDGWLQINGVEYQFTGGRGYMEGDRGRSFPKEYAWTQCSFDGGSLMLSVADIPIGAFHFTGIIGVICLHGVEYRFATYLGARLTMQGGGELVVRQGKYQFRAKLLEKKGRPLKAPSNGAMTRTIRESPSCRAWYSLKRDREKIFSFETSNASFEYEYPEYRTIEISHG